VNKKIEPNFHIVLFQPEIPTNTGNIGRICVASGCHLHLIGPLGFAINEKQVKRAGLDYWPYLQYFYYKNYETFSNTHRLENRLSFLTTKTQQSIYDKKFQKGDLFMFGPETRGLPEFIWKSCTAQSYRIPMVGPTRSLNLANAVSIVSFEGLRQIRKLSEAV